MLYGVEILILRKSEERQSVALEVLIWKKLKRREYIVDNYQGSTENNRE